MIFFTHFTLGDGSFFFGLGLPHGLLSNHREDFQVDSVELIEAAPGTR
jgi:hypothetical protein